MCSSDAAPLERATHYCHSASLEHDARTGIANALFRGPHFNPSERTLLALLRRLRKAAASHLNAIGPLLKDWWGPSDHHALAPCLVLPAACPCCQFRAAYLALLPSVDYPHLLRPATA